MIKNTIYGSVDVTQEYHEESKDDADIQFMTKDERYKRTKTHKNKSITPLDSSRDLPQEPIQLKLK
jgi:hypothetical protein